MSRRELKHEIWDLLFDEYPDWDLETINEEDRDEYSKENEKNRELRIDIIAEIFQEL